MRLSRDRKALALGLALAGVLGGAAAAQTPPMPARRTTYIVAYADSVANPDAPTRALAAAHGLSIRRTFRHALKGAALDGPPGLAAALAAHPGVDLVEVDLPAEAFATSAQIFSTGVPRIGANRNATARIDGSDERVNADIAVLDTGVDPVHPDLAVVRSVSFASNEPDPSDLHGHGTHVAGIAAALDNDCGVVGVAPGARIWSVKVLDKNGRGTFSDVIAGIDYVTQNAAAIAVANMSLGGQGRLRTLRRSIQGAVGKGVIVVVAAGNNRSDVYGPDGTFDTSDDFIPACYPEVATVSALDDRDYRPGGLADPTWDDRVAWFSNYSRSVVAGNPVVSSGKAIDLAAPGVDILSLQPAGFPAPTKRLSGTSMAAPHVAGAAALRVAAGGRDANADGTLDARDVAAIRQALIDAGEPQSEWRAGSTGDLDPNPERLVRVADPLFPRVARIAPAHGGFAMGRATIEAEVAATEPLAAVKFAAQRTDAAAGPPAYAGDLSLTWTDDATSRWTGTWDVQEAGADGTMYELSIRATDASGRTTLEPVQVRIENVDDPPIVSPVAIYDIAGWGQGAHNHCDGTQDVHLFEYVASTVWLYVSVTDDFTPAPEIDASFLVRDLGTGRDFVLPAEPVPGSSYYRALWDTRAGPGPRDALSHPHEIVAVATDGALQAGRSVSRSTTVDQTRAMYVRDLELALRRGGRSTAIEVTLSARRDADGDGRASDADPGVTDGYAAVLVTKPNGTREMWLSALCNGSVTFVFFARQSGTWTIEPADILFGTPQGTYAPEMNQVGAKTIVVP